MQRSIVINREFGSGGSEIGRMICERTGMEFYDTRILQEAASRRGMAADLLASFDERIVTGQYFDLSIIGGTDPETYSLPYRMYAAIAEVVTDAARTAPSVFIGRCTDQILRDANLPFRSVFIYSTDMERKIARAMEVDGVARKDAEKYIAKMDKTRARYQQFFTNTRFGDYREYDLCLNSGRLDYAGCVHLILASTADAAQSPSTAQEASGAAYRAALGGLAPADWPAYLSAHSNLPGPHANLTLIDAAADVLPRDLALSLAAEPDEFPACCGVAALGRLVLDNPGDPVLVDLLTARSADPRRRVREACAIAAQRIGDADPARLRELVEIWTASADPLVVRAGIAAICEPLLLHDPATAAAAVAACRRATDRLLATPGHLRRDDAVRTLRQTLGYCWSLAVAASPEAGLPEFLALPADDPDVGWVVRENRKKKRLARLLTDRRPVRAIPGKDAG